ncbi:MAG TPA: GGDEF domain-containing protein [Polyangiaceae bacterium]|nr:GGDEF domain-containing protein [Polyangiaceae bacterium]
MSVERAVGIERAIAAIRSATIDDASPFAASEVLTRRALGLASPPDDDARRLKFWQSRVPGSRVGDDRYRWELSHHRCKGGSHVPPVDQWRQLRPDAERDAEKAEVRISVPLSVAGGCEYLATLAAGSGELGEGAATLLAEAEPLFRRDLAAYVQATHPWTDTFALRCVAVRPRALDRLRPLALAIAASYAPLAEGGAVLGLRYPIHERPMVSATAQLATGLHALGLELRLLGRLLATVRAGQHDNGGFGDPMPEPFAEKLGREDALTTLVATELLCTLDPSFDPAGALAWFGEQQRPDGFVLGFGPELLWLTGEVVLLARAAARPFAERFRFPSVPSANLDRKTALPFYAFFDDLTHLFGALPGLAGASVPVAFLDLAGFGAFNNAFGQDLGDAVLAAFAAELARVPFARAIRDGGDEFIVVGAPDRRSLASDLDELRKSWPARFRERFGSDVPTVAPRVLCTASAGRELRAARERLGRGMGAVKSASKSPPPEGVLQEI